MVQKDDLDTASCLQTQQGRRTMRRAYTSSHKRLNANLGRETDATLKAYSDKNEVPLTEALRCLVSVGAFVTQAQDEGKQFFVSNEEGTGYAMFGAEGMRP